MPALGLEQDSVEVARLPVWVRVTLPTLREQEIPEPVPEETEADRATVPVKPDELETVITVLPELPAMRVDDGELEAMPKSPTLSVRITRWETVPLVALTMRVYAPGGVVGDAETVIAERPEPPGDIETLF